MICQHCGAFFCADNADLVLLAGEPQRYCDGRCARDAQRKRAKPGERKVRQQHREEVATFPITVVHVVYALVGNWARMRAYVPLTVAEVYEYSRQSITREQTSPSLDRAGHLGLAKRVSRRRWVATDHAREMWVAFEDFALNRAASCCVCTKVFEPPRTGSCKGSRYCSDACREFAREHPGAYPKTLRALWARELAANSPCPSGKVKHSGKADAILAAKTAARLRYRAFPNWLGVYECSLCFHWHLTSKPQGKPSNLRATV